MLAQYYVISRGLIKVRDLYTVDRDGLYVLLFNFPHQEAVPHNVIS